MKGFASTGRSKICPCSFHATALISSGCPTSIFRTRKLRRSTAIRCRIEAFASIPTALFNIRHGKSYIIKLNLSLSFSVCVCFCLFHCSLCTATFFSGSRPNLACGILTPQGWSWAFNYIHQLASIDAAQMSRRDRDSIADGF